MTTPAPKRKVHVRTYGCQMNVYDSERMTDALAESGYEAVDSAEGADLILLNTCHIREKAAEKVYSEIGRLRTLKAAAAAEGRSVTIGITGCVAQAEGDEIMRRAPAVDLVVGPQSYQRLPDLVVSARSGKRVVATDFAVAEKFGVLDRIGHRPPPAGAASSPPTSRSPRSSAPSTAWRRGLPRRGRPPRRAMPPSSPSRRVATSSAPSASSPIPVAPRCRGRPRRSSPRRSGLPMKASAR